MRGKLVITALIAISLVVCAYFGMDYRQEGKEHEALAFQIAEASQILAELPELPQDLEQQLAMAEVHLDTEQSAFPSRINSTAVINSILELADDCGVEAIPLVTQPWSIEKVGEHDYHALRLNVAVEGSLSHLLTFVGKLENGEFKTLIVEVLSVTRDTEQPEEETILITASLDLAIYTQSLTSD